MMIITKLMIIIIMIIIIIIIIVIMIMRRKRRRCVSSGAVHLFPSVYSFLVVLISCFVNIVSFNLGLNLLTGSG